MRSRLQPVEAYGLTGAPGFVGYGSDRFDVFQCIRTKSVRFVTCVP